MVYNCIKYKFSMSKGKEKDKKKEIWIKPEFEVFSLEDTQSKTFNGTEQFMGEITNREPS